MSLVQGYSSDEDDGPVTTSSDVFGLTNLPANKKLRVNNPAVELKVEAAPHVLSEVRNFVANLTYCVKLTSRAGSFAPNIVGYAVNGYTNEREHSLRGHDEAFTGSGKPIWRPQSLSQPKCSRWPCGGAVDDRTRFPTTTFDPFHPRLLS